MNDMFNNIAYILSIYVSIIQEKTRPYKIRIYFRTKLAFWI